MKGLLRRALHLFVDSPVLAASAVLWIGLCAALVFAGLRPIWAGVLLPPGLALALAVSVHGAISRPR